MAANLARDCVKPYLRGEDREGHEGAEEAQGDPVGGELADAKVEQQELQLGGHGQRGPPDVLGAAPPQLHGPAGPAMLLLAVRKEAGGELRMRTNMSA